MAGRIISVVVVGLGAGLLGPPALAADVPPNPNPGAASAPGPGSTTGPATNAPASPYLSENQRILDAWAQANGMPPPAMIAQADGSTRLDWQLEAATEAYGNRVRTNGDAQLNTPMQDGAKARQGLGFALRSAEASGDVNFMQGALLATNDRALLRNYSNQVTSFQVGRTTGQYQVLAGDVAANYSPLSSNLGLRGVMGQLKLGGLSFSTHMGTVAESWDALTNRSTLTGLPARSTYLRDVAGLKLDYETTPGFHVFATSQAYADRSGSLGGTAGGNGSGFALKAAETQSSTAGVAYQGADWQATLESGSSRFGNKGESKVGGNATLFNAAYRMGDVTWRAGRNDIGTRFVSLAAAAAPGIEESYLGADWQASPILMLGMDGRRGANRVAATEFSDAARSPFRAFNSRAALNLQSVVPGLMLQLQDSRARNEDPQGAVRNMDSTNLGLAYSAPAWNGTLGYARTQARDAASPSFDSNSDAWQFAIGKQIMSDPQTSVPWMLSLAFTGNWQVQHILATAQQTRSRNAGFTLGGRHQKWGGFNLALMSGDVMQPNGGPMLRQTMLQSDATYPVTPNADLRFYWRHTVRNSGSDSLRTTERSGGANLNLRF